MPVGDAVQRRCYWLLEGDDNVVLVHYLSSNPQENCVMRGPPTKGGALSLNAVELPKSALQVPNYLEPVNSVGVNHAKMPLFDSVTKEYFVIPGKCSLVL